MSEHFEKRINESLRATADCPTLDQLLDLLDGKQGEETRARAESHSATCPHCSTELALFREFNDSTPRPEERTDVAAIVERLRKKDPWWKKWTSMQWMAPASVVLAALLIGVFLRTPESSSAPRIGNQDPLRSGRVQAVAPTATVSERPDKLTWQAVKGAANYQVNVSEVDQTLLWTANVATPEAPLPAEVLAKLTPRKTLVWRIAALDERGAVLADSGAVRFQFIPSLH